MGFEDFKGIAKEHDCPHCLAPICCNSLVAELKVLRAMVRHLTIDQRKAMESTLRDAAKRTAMFDEMDLIDAIREGVKAPGPLPLMLQCGRCGARYKSFAGPAIYCPTCLDDMPTRMEPTPTEETPKQITDDEAKQLDHCFAYHRPTEDQLPKYEAIRAAAKQLARTITECCPPSADRTTAFRQVQDAVMTANRSIALGGKGMR